MSSIGKLALAVGLLLPSAALPAEVWLFDMGSDESPLQDGYVRVTPSTVYTADKGYGWETAEDLRAHVQDHGREWQFNESRGTKQPPPIYTTSLTCDSLLSKRTNSFLIKVPAGDYLVYVLAGRSAGSPRDYYQFEISASTSRDTIKIPGPYIFTPARMRVAVADPPLRITFTPQTEWLVAALIVCPWSERDEVEKQIIQPREVETFFLPPDVAREWQETRHSDTRPLPEFSARDRQRGYAVFARHWSEVIFPNTVPRAEELDPQLRTFAALGEYEPVTLTVYPLAHVPELRVTAGDLRSADARIPTENIDIRCVRYQRVRPNYSTYYSYHVAPDVLERHTSVALTPGENRRFWITIRAPEEAVPGVYSGSLSLASPNQPPSVIPLTVRVLPIRLSKNPDHIYGMYYRDPLSQCDEGNSALANEYFARKAAAERNDMFEHGMNTHTSSVSGLQRDDQGRWSIDGEETERRIALDRAHGLGGKPLVVSFPVETWYARLVDSRGLGSHLRLVRDNVPDSFFAEVTRMVEAIEQERQQRNWPEFLYYPIDEPSTEEKSVRFMVNVLRAVKQVPGARTYITADPSHEHFAPLWPYVDVWCCQPFVFGYDKIRQLSAEKNIEFWCYPNHISGENDHTPARGARMTWGFGFWRSGFKALIPWIYQSSSGDPWNYLDGTSMDFFNRSAPDGEPIPVTLWEAYREGIDDGRYVYTLEQLIQTGKQRGGEAAIAADKAEKELQYVWNAIDVQEKYKYDGLWSGRDFDAYRWLLASEILRLNSLLKN